MLEKIITQGQGVSITILISTLVNAKPRLLDESVMVRKKCLKLCNTLINSCPVGDIYGTSEQFDNKICQTKAELDKLRKETVLESGKVKDVENLQFQLELLVLMQKFNDYVAEMIDELCEYHLVARNEAV